MDAEWRAAAERWLRALDDQNTLLHRAVDELASRVAQLEADSWRAAVDSWLRALDLQGTDLHRGHGYLAERIARLERHDRVRTVTRWVEAATLHHEPLISVVVPTRDRLHHLERALRSLLAQRYAAWEAIVVDDGGGGAADPASVIEAAGDARVRLVRSAGGVGACAARNVGLEHVRGSLVAYLDDDNEMEPLWLKAVAWAFEQRPEVASLFGGLVIGEAPASDAWEPPVLWFLDYDPAMLARQNLADSSSLAHRAGAAGARWDESFRHYGDWRMLVSLASHSAPLALPVVACRYHRDAPDRLTASTPPQEERDAVAAAARGALR